jgi:hypothetical protein
MVRGPGTVGLDASLSSDEVAYTALEALEYYGVYAISRAYDPSFVNPAVAAQLSAEISAAAPVDEVPGTNGELDVRALSPLTSHRDSHRALSAAQKSKQKRRSSLCYRPGRKLSNEFGPLEAGENADPQAGLELLPELPEDAIKSRRISMGVYEMFTKL